MSLGWGAGALAQEPPTAAPPSPEPRVEGSVVHLEGLLDAPLDTGCPVEGVLLVDTHLYVACGAGGVAIYDLSDRRAAQLLRRGRLEGRALGFFRAGDRVFVTFAQTTARPVDELALRADGAASGDGALAPTGTPLPAAAAPSRPRGEVLSASSDRFIVSLGALDGVVVGDRVAVRRVVETADLEGERAVVEETLVVGRVATTSDHRAEVLLGLNEQAPVGAIAEETTDPVSARLLAPSTDRSPFELAATLRPFLPLQDLGLGVLGDLTGTFRFRSLMVRLQFDTLGLGFGSGSTQTLFNGGAIFAYEHRFFAAGVGVGLMRNDEAREDSRGEEYFGTRLAVSQYARLGERDGLSVSLTNHVALVEDEDCQRVGGEYVCGPKDEFHWAAIYVDVLVPVISRGWLVFRGGGGHVGMANGEVGFRLLVRGNGGTGSVFVTPLVGGAMIRNDEDSRRTGPSVAVRVEWRP